jgi:ATP-dependent DNA helicase RecQ
LARFVDAARLLPGQTVSRDLLAVSRDAGLDPRSVENQLLAWDDADWLRYRGIGRDMLLALPQAPGDSRERVAALLADYHAGQEGRIVEMMAYATTRLCRHGYISAYFGGRPIETCEACDNCLEHRTGRPATPRDQPARPATPPPAPQPLTDQETTTLVLLAVAKLPFPLGRTGLAQALVGADNSPVSGERFPLFGTLAGHSRKSVGQFAAQLVDQGLLAYFQKGRYPLLQLTAKGQAWLDGDRREPVAASLASPRGDDPGDYDEALFERLRAWRLDVAREIAKPPYVVFHDSVLKRIAAARPATRDDLAAIKGIGPSKLEQYGPAVLALIRNDKGEDR